MQSILERKTRSNRRSHYTSTLLCCQNIGSDLICFHFWTVLFFGRKMKKNEISIKSASFHRSQDWNGDISVSSCFGSRLSPPSTTLLRLPVAERLVTRQNQVAPGKRPLAASLESAFCSLRRPRRFFYSIFDRSILVFRISCREIKKKRNSI